MSKSSVIVTLISSLLISACSTIQEQDINHSFDANLAESMTKYAIVNTGNLTPRQQW